MKLTRKLIPAMIMLLVSAVLMSTASFAWFSMNTQVTATDIKVTAVAPKSLWITTENNLNNLAHTVKLASDVESPNAHFVPVKDALDAETGAVTFQKLTTNDALKVGADGQLETGFTPTYEAATKDHFHDTLYLQLTGDAQTTQKIGVQATISGPTDVEADLIYQAIKVVLVVHEGDAYSKVELDFESLSTDAATATQLLSALAPNAAAPTAVDVYVFVDGEDEACKNANAYNNHQFAISLSFTIIESTGN